MTTILQGDWIEELRRLPDRLFHCCVTSPPYWGLRDYGVDGQLGIEKTPEEYVAKVVAGFREVRRVLRDDGTLWLNLGSSYYHDSPSGPQGKTGQRSGRRFTAEGCGGGLAFDDKHPTQSPGDAPACGIGDTEPRCFPGADRACPYCGGELLDGSEIRRAYNAHSDQPNEQSKPPSAPTAHGSERGDCAASSPPASGLGVEHSTIPASGVNGRDASFREATGAELPRESSTSLGSSLGCAHSLACKTGTSQTGHPSVYHMLDTGLFCKACGYSTIAHPSFKPKDLVPIPWMVAMALQADGWYLRSEIIWAKPNPMPESVTDRPTKSHEQIFLLSKSAAYFYDAEAVKEPSISDGHGPQICTAAENDPNHDGPFRTRAGLMRGVPNTGSRNRRSVWTVPSQPYREAHFATFPEDLIKPCVLAGASARGCCPKCGAPWERIVEDGEPDADHRAACGADSTGGYNGHATKDYGAARCQDPSAVKARILAGVVKKETVGWQPTCDCGEAAAVPCTVLDPFGGSGTTGKVANELGRKAVLIELNPKYVELIRRRTDVTPGLLIA